MGKNLFHILDVMKVDFEEIVFPFGRREGWLMAKFSSLVVDMAWMESSDETVFCAYRHKGALQETFNPNEKQKKIVKSRINEEIGKFFLNFPSNFTNLRRKFSQLHE